MSYSITAELDWFESLYTPDELNQAIEEAYKYKAQLDPYVLKYPDPNSSDCPFYMTNEPYRDSFPYTFRNSGVRHANSKVNIIEVAPNDECYCDDGELLCKFVAAVMYDDPKNTSVRFIFHGEDRVIWGWDISAGYITELAIKFVLSENKHKIPRL